MAATLADLTCGAPPKLPTVAATLADLACGAPPKLPTVAATLAHLTCGAPPKLPTVAATLADLTCGAPPKLPAPVLQLRLLQLCSVCTVMCPPQHGFRCLLQPCRCCRCFSGSSCTR